MLLKEILVSAGLPVPALQVVTGSGSLTGRALIEYPDLDMLFFTGSIEVGLEVNETAAKQVDLA
jgi:phenylacetaldehyde dehydrogenase